MRLHIRLLLVPAALLITFGSGAGCSKSAEVPAGVTTPASEALNVSDVDVSEHVKTALLQAESLKGMDITVVTTKGDVRLTGIVKSRTQIDQAVRIARAVEGAHSIHNELTITE